MRALTVAVAAAIAISAAGCSKYESLGLSGSGSMRIEVEVYKGPLGQPKEIQVGELAAILTESVLAMKNWQGAALDASKRGYCSSKFDSKQDCRYLQDAIESSEEIIFGICQIFPAWIDVARLTNQIEVTNQVIIIEDACSSSKAIGQRPTLPEPERRAKVVLGDTRISAYPSIEEISKNRMEIARRIASIAGAMKSKAFRIADATVAYVPRDDKVRTLLVNFGLIASEYSNQIQARTAVLYKQYDDPERIAKTLPVSDYLRDASQTDFIQLFDWYRATSNQEGMEGYPGKLDPQERIRMAERLFADYYWEKVNEVYASGQGDVKMAFIKNDIGNWDLKSFGNDPAELLDAYTDAADSVLQAVVRIAGNVSTAGGAEAAAQVGEAQGLFDLASQITSGVGSSPALVAGLDVSALHAHTAAKLEMRKKEFSERALKLEQERSEAAAQAQAILDQPEEERDAAALADAQMRRDVAVARLNDLPAEAAAAARGILDDHLVVIATLQEGIARAAEPQP